MINIAKTKIKKVVRHLRRQPEDVRVQISHIATVTVAIIMIILWTYSLGRSLADTETQVKIKQDLQPFSVLKDNMVGGYKSISIPSADVVR